MRRCRGQQGMNLHLSWHNAHACRNNAAAQQQQVVNPIWKKSNAGATSVISLQLSPG